MSLHKQNRHQNPAGLTPLLVCVRKCKCVQRLASGASRKVATQEDAQAEIRGKLHGDAKVPGTVMCVT